jgi:hypothetical protein
MHSLRRRSQIEPHLIGYLSLSVALILLGCASPGPPKAPSLKLPQPVRDLTAIRIGNSVELHFTAPANSTDKLPLRVNSLSGQLCRQLPHQPCTPTGPRLSIPVSNSNDNHNLVTWTDTLPPTLTDGPPQLLAYRVEFFSPGNRSAGPSNQSLTASGQAPAPVQNLRAQGSRQGIVLQWTPSPGDLVLNREDLAPSQPKPTRKAGPAIVWLQANDSKNNSGHTLDTTALPDTPYRYIAQRRTTLELASHSIELRSPLSEPITITLSTVYPPPPPTGLTAAAYSTETPPAFAVDLIWQPINETGLITHLAGYNLYRETLNAAGESTAKRQQMNSLPIAQPAFHDPTADPATTYRYSVTAIDTKGNESPATTVTLKPTP